MHLRASSEEAAMSVLIAYGMKREDARAVFQSIFQLGFSSGKLEGHQEAREELRGT
jgi:predicted transposase YdaD